MTTTLQSLIEYLQSKGMRGLQVNQNVITADFCYNDIGYNNMPFIIIINFWEVSSMFLKRYSTVLRNNLTRWSLATLIDDNPDTIVWLNVDCTGKAKAINFHQSSLYSQLTISNIYYLKKSMFEYER